MARNKKTDRPLAERPQGPTDTVAFAARSETRITSGPFPPPSLLAEYKHLHPDFPERIFIFTENEQSHRHSLEQQIVAAQIQDMRDDRIAERRGQWLALVVCLAVFGCATAVALSGSPVSGALLAGASLVGIVSVFITRRHANQSPQASSEVALDTKTNRTP